MCPRRTGQGIAAQLEIRGARGCIIGNFSIGKEPEPPFYSEVKRMGINDIILYIMTGFMVLGALDKAFLHTLMQ